DASPREAVRLGAAMVRAAPMRNAVVALALARAHADTAGLIESALASEDAASRMLAARILALAGRPAEGIEALSAASDPALQAAIVAARAQLAADAGRWEDVERAVESLRSSVDLESRWALALALAA